MQYIDFADTIELMTSPNYKDRLAAEYIQTKIRYDRLYRVIMDYLAGRDLRYAGKEMENALKTQNDILIEQLRTMEAYLNILEIRARRDNVDIRTGTIIEYYKAETGKPNKF